MIAIQCTTCETVSPLPEWNSQTGGCPVCNVEFYADPSTHDKKSAQKEETR